MSIAQPRTYIEPAVKEFALTFRTVTNEAEFIALEPVWRALQAASERCCGYLTWEWASAWWEHFGRRCPLTGDRGTLETLVIEDAGVPVAIFPFFVRHPSLFSFRLKRLQLIGYNGKLDVCGLTEEPILLVRSGFETTVFRALNRHLESQARRFRFDAFTIQYLVARDRVTPLLGMRTQRKPGPQVITLPDTWQEFRKQLGKSMRDNMAYYPRLLERSGHQWSVRIATSDSDVDQAVEDLVRLHEKRVVATKGKRRSYFNHPSLPKFYAKAHRELAKRGEAFVAVLDVDGQPAAAQAFLLHRGELVAGYSGFDPAFAQFSPLFVLECAVFKCALERGARTINLLGGEAQWQKRWRPEVRDEMVTAMSVSRNPLSWVKAGVHFARREAVLLSRRHRFAVKFASLREKLIILCTTLQLRPGLLHLTRFHPVALAHHVHLLAR